MNLYSICTLLILFIMLECHVTNATDQRETNVRQPLNRIKRFVSMETLQPNREFQACNASRGRPGHCRHIHYCIVNEMRSNYAQFFGYLCRIEGSFMVGVCCPDGTPNKINSTEIIFDKLIDDTANTDIRPIAINELPDITERLSSSTLSGSKSRGCGIGRRSKPRIVGGRPAEPRDWPWMTALLRDRTTQYCGGVLVTQRQVISAAHCTDSLKPHQIRVRVGEYDFRREDDSSSRDYRIISIKQHPRYDETNFANDISILKTHTAVSFDDYVWPICLPLPDEDFVNKTAIVAGWGTLGFAEPTSSVLMEVDLQMWSQAMCETALDQNITETQLCAGSFGQRKDACQGDSGGPLMHRLPSGRWIVTGIVSWGRACGIIGQPGIYTRVNKYLPWIVENTADQ